MSGLKSDVQPVERAVTDRRRLDVQGLRAVAVLLVVAIHAGLPVPGGFVGVDVFFVISGFVITGMIQRELSSTGRFRFGRFYLRRFKRLIPALAVTVAVTMVLSFCLLSPFITQRGAAQTGLGAMLLVANFVIVRIAGDYVGAPVASNPLQHTWSLSVEEQFYLMFPAVLLLGYVLSGRGRQIPWAKILVGAAAALSFWLATMGASALGPLASSPAKYLVGFCGPFARSWEFAVGALLALATTSRLLGSYRQAQFLALLGATLLVASTRLINSVTLVPGPWTLLPVGGTFLLIAAGTHHTTWLNRALALPAMVKIGDWSYSIYLWHWPLISFVLYLFPRVQFAALIAGIASILPAVVSYRWIEQPLRRLPPLSRPRTLALIGAVVVPPIVLAATVNFAADHFWLPRYKSGVVPIAHQGDRGWADFVRHLGETYYPCSDQAVRDNTELMNGVSRCWQSKTGPHVDVALIGDSHAEQLFLGLAEAIPSKNIVLYYENALPVTTAAGMNRVIDHVAANSDIRTVIVTADWANRGIAAAEFVKTLEAFRSPGKAVFVTVDRHVIPPGCPSGNSATGGPRV